MPIIPLRQDVTVSPFIGSDPDWNTPVYGEDYEMKCRFSEGVKLVRDRNGAEVASVGTFYFDKIPRISINDLFTFTNENNDELTYTPIAIAVKRAINGKPILTEVNV